jgi:hypothetical protein
MDTQACRERIENCWPWRKNWINLMNCRCRNGSENWSNGRNRTSHLLNRNGYISNGNETWNLPWKNPLANQPRSGCLSSQERGMKRVRVEKSLLSATVLGCLVVLFMFVIGCASTRAVVEPQVETASPSPVVDPAPGSPTGPPPGHVEPKNYVVREKIVLGEVTTVIDREIPSSSEPTPSVSATQKSSVKKGKKNKKTAKRVTE